MAEYQHNNPWAEKLLQVSLPDGDKAWRAMESRLDAQGPWWRNRDTRRWVLLILLLLLLIGVCNCPCRSRLFHGNATVSREPAPLAPAASALMPEPIPRESIPKVPATAAHNPRTSAPESPGAQRLVPAPLVPAFLPPASAVPASPASVSLSDRHGPASDEPGSSRIFPGPTPPARRTVSSNAGVHAELVSGAKLLHPTGKAHPGHTGRLSRKNIAARLAGDRPGTDTSFGDRQNADTSIAGKSMTQGKPTSSASPPGSHILRLPAPNDSASTRTSPTPSLTKSSSARDSVRRRPPTPPKKEEEEQKEREHGLMAAIGLNQFFPLGGQQSVYSTDGTGGTLRDYIPVPVVRYYFSRKLYVQVEAQFNTPQATRKNLVISSPPPDTSSISGEQIVSSASLRQLFYFNIPLSVHYTLFDNIDIGTGLQFSRLTNAVGSFDTTTSPLIIINTPTISTNEVKSFKGDALYQKIKTDEFRFLLDMSYTYKHFIAGLRYNQALSKFVDIQIAPGQVAQGRNSSLQLYLRYILWDGRKNRTSPAK